MNKMKHALRKLVKKYLSKTTVMQLSTCVNNKPWTCTVFFAYDEKFNLYFISRNTRRHSIELSKNLNVSGAIVVSYKTAGYPVVGLQFEGKAYLVLRKEFGRLSKIFLKRFPKVKNLLADGNSGVAKLYKVIPSGIVLYDEINFPSNSRQELKLVKQNETP